jgi:hypothetical protein
MMDHLWLPRFLTSLQQLIVHQIAAARNFAVYKSCAHNVGTLFVEHTDNAFGCQQKRCSIYHWQPVPHSANIQTSPPQKSSNTITSDKDQKKLLSTMTFLSHSIPWLSLSHLFEYHAARSRPGPQQADLYCKESPAYRKQLEHFATTFQKTVREHGLVERGRFSTAQRYRDRAATWTQSSVEEPPARGQHALSSDATDEARDADGSIETPAATLSSSTETRRVYPTHFSDTYMSLVPPTSGGFYGREGLLASLADVKTWIEHCARKRVTSPSDPDEGIRNKIWLDNKSCADVLKLLVIDASTTNSEPQRKQNLSTILLLANHPNVNLRNFLSDGMCCCNMEAGLWSLVEKTAMVFIYLNLLLVLTADQSGAKLLLPCDSVDEYRSSGRHGHPLTRLLPRPAYMNMGSFLWMQEQALDEHGHAVEHVLFNPLFAPRPGGALSKWFIPNFNPMLPSFSQLDADEDRFERDVMVDRQGLHEALKSMWKALVFCDMVFREAGKTINWEKVSIVAIRQLFVRTGVGKLVGGNWSDYEMEREDKGGFKYYVDEDVNVDVDEGVDADEDGDSSGNTLGDGSL